MLKWGFKDMSLIWEVIWEGGSRTEERKIPAKGRQCVNRYCVHLELSPIAGQEPWAVSPPTAIPCCWGLFTGVNPLAVLTCPVSAQRPSLWLAQTTEIYFLKVLEASLLIIKKPVILDWIPHMAQWQNICLQRQEMQVSSLRSGRSPAVGNGNPFQYSCWEAPLAMEPGGLYTPWGHKESTMIGHALTHAYWIWAIWPHFLLIISLKNLSPMQSHPKMLRVRTSIYEFWGNTTEPMTPVSWCNHVRSSRD